MQKIIKNVKGETLILPEEVIQRIQSLMSGKEAARSAILSKSWYAAWLTRPTIALDERLFVRDAHDVFEDINFDEGDFGPVAHEVFEEFAEKTMQRYQDLNLNIKSFTLHMWRDYYRCASTSHNLIVSAIKMGATHLKLTINFSILPQEVLGSQTLVKLFLNGFKFDGSYIYVINCLMLKSLTLDCVNLTSDAVFKDLTSHCVSMEELSLSYCAYLELRRTNMYELHKLRRLFLNGVNVDNMFFTDFASRFPCLKDLTIHKCYGYTRIHIATTSLQTISFEPKSRLERAKFDVPNIREFTYSCYGLPSNLSINGASSWEWELDISIVCLHSCKISWFLNLKKALKNFRLSRISLFIDVQVSHCPEVDVEVSPNPLVLENLMIHAPSIFCCALLVRSFRVFRPKFITHHD